MPRTETCWSVRILDFDLDTLTVIDRDNWPICYASEADAEAAKERLASGMDKSFYDPETTEGLLEVYSFRI